MAYCEQPCSDCPLNRISDSDTRVKAQRQIGNTFLRSTSALIRSADHGSYEKTVQQVVEAANWDPRNNEPADDLQTTVVTSAVNKIANNRCATQTSWGASKVPLL